MERFGSYAAVISTNPKDRSKIMCVAAAIADLKTVRDAAIRHVHEDIIGAPAL